MTDGLQLGELQREQPCAQRAFDQKGGQSEQREMLCTLQPCGRLRCDPRLGHDTDSTGLVAEGCARVPRSHSFSNLPCREMGRLALQEAAWGRGVLWHRNRLSGCTMSAAMSSRRNHGRACLFARRGEPLC